jgi:hypothetical protein
MTIEKRHHARVETRIPATIQHRGRSFSAIVKNLSRGGLFLETGQLSIPRGNMVDACFRLDDKEWALSGLIVEQVDTDGLCIMFPEPQPALLEQARRQPEIEILPDSHQQPLGTRAVAGTL